MLAVRYLILLSERGEPFSRDVYRAVVMAAVRGGRGGEGGQGGIKWLEYGLKVLEIMEGVGVRPDGGILGGVIYLASRENMWGLCESLGKRSEREIGRRGVGEGVRESMVGAARRMGKVEEGLEWYEKILDSGKVGVGVFNDVGCMLGGEKERWRGYEVVRKTMKVARGAGGWGARVGRREGKDFVVDCHGFGVETSRLLVVWGLNVAYEKGCGLVCVVGKGKGSKDGPIVAMQMLDFLLGELDLEGRLDEGNFGRIIVEEGEVEKSVEKSKMWVK